MNKIIPENRIKHMHGVAEYMYQNAEKYGLNPDEMYFLGLNHDIGYINGKSGHEDYGAELISKIGLSDEFVALIRCHGMTPQEYKDVHGCFDYEIPKALILLWEADMHVDLSGEDVGYEVRLENIGNELGFDSNSYQICKETIDWLLNQNK